MRANFLSPNLFSFVLDLQPTGRTAILNSIVLLALLHVFLQDRALQNLVVLVLIQILHTFGIKLTTILQNFFQMALLLVTHHGDICGRSGYTLALAIPDNRLASISLCLAHCLVLMLQLLSLASKDVRALLSKPS